MLRRFIFSIADSHREICNQLNTTKSYFDCLFVRLNVSFETWYHERSMEKVFSLDIITS